jgi:hypothetical protein
MQRGRDRILGVLHNISENTVGENHYWNKYCNNESPFELMSMYIASTFYFHNYIIYFNNYIFYNSLPPPPPPPTPLDDVLLSIQRESITTLLEDHPFEGFTWISWRNNVILGHITRSSTRRRIFQWSFLGSLVSTLQVVSEKKHFETFFGDRTFKN